MAVTFAALAIAGLQPVSAQAGSIPAGDDIIIIGTFDSPQLEGNIVNDPAVGQLTFMNNTNSAVFAIGVNYGTATVVYARI